jgi:hypothetical protein
MRKSVVDRLEKLETIFLSLTLAMTFCLFLVAIASKYVVEGW